MIRICFSNDEILNHSPIKKKLILLRKNIIQIPNIFAVTLILKFFEIDLSKRKINPSSKEYIPL